MFAGSAFCFDNPLASSCAGRIGKVKIVKKPVEKLKPVSEVEGAVVVVTISNDPVCVCVCVRMCCVSVGGRKC